MPSEGSRGELGFPNNQLVDSLDEVAKGLAAGTISRRGALKLAGSALLGGGLLALFPGVGSAQVSAQAGCAGRPAVNNKRCPLTSCGGNPDCFCATTTSKNKVCVGPLDVIPCPNTDECDSNRNCATGEVCIKIGGCCEGNRNNLCVPKCS